MRIVYYAHHHGSGHLRHARRVQRLGLAEVVVVGGPGADVVLPADVDPAQPHTEPVGSPFHWTPTTPAVRDRFMQWHRVLDQVDPDLVMVDVSVEAAVFAHLAGYPVVHRRMHGDRDDAAHRLVYDTARRLFAYYPQRLEAPGFGWQDRTSWLGMVADGHPADASAVERGTVVVLSGAGGNGVPADGLALAAAGTPRRTWHVLGPRLPAPDVRLPGNVVQHGWVDDPTPWLARAEVVVCGAGHNTVATVAASGRPLVLVPEPRPHDEQLRFAEQLHRCFGVPTVTSWAGADWASLLANPGDGRAMADGLLSTPGEFRAAVAQFLRDATEETPGT